ncbi:MAG TPA: hypothetical protein VJJ78_03070 [Candidatus Saccharimonadales bacterium]|nr:hypothetical protein [Candidatus Saccharimonadales bacterium]
MSEHRFVSSAGIGRAISPEWVTNVKQVISEIDGLRLDDATQPGIVYASPAELRSINGRHLGEEHLKTVIGAFCLEQEIDPLVTEQAVNLRLNDFFVVRSGRGNLRLRASFRDRRLPEYGDGFAITTEKGMVRLALGLPWDDSPYVGKSHVKHRVNFGLLRGQSESLNAGAVRDLKRKINRDASFEAIDPLTRN